MKKYLIIVLVMLLLLTGCSSGISQADYDAMVAERNAALEENRVLKEKLAAYEQNHSEEPTPDTTELVTETVAEPVTEPAPDTKPREENISELLSFETVEWHKHYINADHYHCDLIVTNNSQQLVTAKFAIKYFDAAGNVIGVSNVSTEALGSGETHFLSASNEAPFEYAEVSITSAKPDGRYNGSLADVSCNDYAVNSEKVIFEVTNNGDAAVSFVRANVLFYNGDEVIDSDYAYAVDDDNELKPGATLMSEVSTNKSFTSYRIFYYGRID